MSNLVSFDAEMFALSNYMFDRTSTVPWLECLLIEIGGAGNSKQQLNLAGSNDLNR